MYIISGAQEAADKRRKNDMLKMYYGMAKQGEEPTNADPIDINGAHFQPNTYLSKLLKVRRI